MALNKEFPRTPPDRRAKYVYGHRLHSWFAIGSALLLFGVLWMIWQDYDREWKVYQRQFWDLKKQRFEDEYREEYYKVQADAQQLSEQEAAARTALEGVQDKLQAMKSDLDKLNRKDLYDAKQQQKFSKAELDTALFHLEEARKRWGEDNESAYAEEQRIYDGWLADFDAKDDRLKQVEGEVKRLGDEIQTIEKSALDLKKRHAETVLKRDNIYRNLESMLPSVANAIRDAPMLDFIDPNLKVQQRVLDDIQLDYYFAKVQIVDRCETCHQGIADPYWSSDRVEQPFLAHPRLDLYVSGKSPHPVESFGCTVCHRGRPASTEFVWANHEPNDHHQTDEWKKHYGWKHDHWWNRPMYAKKYVQASCLKCHSEAVHLEGAEKLMRGKALFRDFGCYGCHKATKMEDVTVGGELPRRGPDLKDLATKTTKDWTYNWVWDPKHFRPSTRMPRFFGQNNNLTGADRLREQTEALGIVEYLYAHSTAGTPAAPGRGDAKRGGELVESVGCTACHRITDPPLADGRMLLEPVAGTGGRNHGPELSRIGAKTNAAWLAAWIENPQIHNPGSRMPRLRLDKQQRADVAAYLMTLDGGYQVPARPQADPAQVDALLLAKFQEKLTRAGAESELASLDAQQRIELVGLNSIRKHGCAGCHNIPGFETEGKIGTDLYKQGSKPLTKLDFGLIGDGHGHKEIKPGSVDKHGVPVPPAIHHTLHDFLWNKLRTPRIYDWGKEKAPKDRLKMPNFEMTEEQAEAVVTFVLGNTEDPMPLHRMAGARKENGVADRAAKRYLDKQRGWWAIREYNCIACHRFEHEKLTIRQTRDGAGDLQTWNEGTTENPVRAKEREFTVHGLTTVQEDGERIFQLWRRHHLLPDKQAGSTLSIPAHGEIRHEPVVGELFADYYLNYLRRKSGQSALTRIDAANDLPPSLVGEGHKVQPPWVFKFLKDVEVLRPWLDIRMPSFDMPDKDARAIAAYFAAQGEADHHERITAMKGTLGKLEAKAKRVPDDAAAGRAQMLEQIAAATALLEREQALFQSAFPFEKYPEREPSYLEGREAALQAAHGQGAYLDRAWRLINRSDVNCFNCHFRDGVAPAGDRSMWAPDLKFARERLRPQWIEWWLRNPQQVQPGTKMPLFRWAEYGNTMAGTADERIRAVKDMLMNLDQRK